MMTTFEAVRQLAKDMAALAVKRGDGPCAQLPLVEVTNEHHVPIYGTTDPCDLWYVGTIRTVYGDKKTLSPVYLAADGTIAYLWPHNVGISTGYEASGRPVQRVGVLVLRKVKDGDFSDTELDDLYDVICSM